jgi:long-chain acyl-CoA synthetase
MVELILGDGLRRNAIRFPDKNALVHQDKRITYRELNERVNRLANAFTAHGLKKGDKIAILLRSCSEFIEIVFAAAKTGIISVPLNYRAITKDLEYMINLSEATALIFGEEFEDLVNAAKPQLNQVKHFLVIAERVKARAENYEKFLLSGLEKEPEIVIHETDPVWFIFTSGTTGKPKACVQVHRGWVVQSLALAMEFDIRQNDTYLNTGPLHFLAQFCMVIMYLYIGAAVVIMKDVDPLETLKLIEKEKVTQAFMVPTLLNFIMNLSEEEKRGWDFRSMRVIIVATAPLLTKTKEEVLKYFSSARLYDLYGASETGINTVLKPEDQMRKIRCCGKPFTGVDIKLLDDDGKEVPVGEVGQLYVKGFNILKEYYKNPEATKECWRDEWITVGDVARMDEEGYYYIVDRKKDMVISGGVNIYPIEIDEVIQKHPKVFEVAVIGVPDETWGESLKAIIVLKEGEKATEEEIKKFCEGKLARYKIPSSVEFISSLPKTAGGKIQRSVLRAKYWEGQDVSV